MPARPRSERRYAGRDLCSSAVFLLFSVLVCFESYRLGLGTWQHLGAGYFPFVASVVLGLISLSVLIRSLLNRCSGPEGSARDEVVQPIRRRYILLTLAGLLGYVVLFEPLGFAIATLLVMAFLVRAVGGATWRVTAITAISVTVASYLLFDVALDASLPHGILEEFF